MSFIFSIFSFVPGFFFSLPFVVTLFRCFYLSDFVAFPFMFCLSLPEDSCSSICHVVLALYFAPDIRGVTYCHSTPLSHDTLITRLTVPIDCQCLIFFFAISLAGIFTLFDLSSIIAICIFFLCFSRGYNIFPLCSCTDLFHICIFLV